MRDYKLSTDRGRYCNYARFPDLLFFVPEGERDVEQAVRV